MSYQHRYYLVCDKCGKELHDHKISRGGKADSLVEEVKKAGWQIALYNEDLLKVGVNSLCDKCRGPHHYG